MEKNYVTWAKNYIPVVEKTRWEKEELKRLANKVNWTLGGQMPLAWFFDNVVLCTEVGIKIKVLDSKHSPYVSIPEVVAGNLGIIYC